MLIFEERRYFRVTNFTVVNIVVTRFRIGTFGVEPGELYCDQISQLFIHLILLSRKDCPQKPHGTRGTTDFAPTTHDPSLCTHDPRICTHDPRL